MNEQLALWSTLMQKNKDEHIAIANLLVGKKVCYLDIPIHFNVGDLLIYKGTEKFLAHYNINVIYRSDCKNYSSRKIAESDTIIFHGGGNFGDLYKDHQDFRERIIQKYHNKMIIILPQTIYFKSEDNLIKTKKILNSHPNLYLCVRDKRSFDIGKAITENVFLLPDMAHSLHPLIEERELNTADNNNCNKIINLIRRDIEKTNENRLQKQNFDWDDLITPNDILWKKIYLYSAKIPSYDKFAINIWSKLTDSILFKSINFFYFHDEIYTDRLHGIILSSLLGKKIHMFDNSYGKNSSYIDSWLKEYPLFI